jgi:AraC-like DNA-binding protein
MTRDVLAHRVPAAEAAYGPPAPKSMERLPPARPVLYARGGLSGWQRQRVAEFIEANLAKTVRLAQLADLVALSPYHFARAFKVSFGVPPLRYHLERRMLRAKELLLAPDSSVTAVALAVGFAETGSFSAAFRRLSGVAPSRYRKDWQRIHGTSGHMAGWPTTGRDDGAQGV